METKEKETLLNDFLQEIFKVLSVQDVNHKPHPYVITDKHITGRYKYLDSNAITQLEQETQHLQRGRVHCGAYTSPDGKRWANGYQKGWHKCYAPYSEHTSQEAAFIQLKRNATQAEVQALFKNLLEQHPNIVDGFTFVETDEKFRIS